MRRGQEICRPDQFLPNISTWKTLTRNVQSQSETSVTTEPLRPVNQLKVASMWYKLISCQSVFVIVDIVVVVVRILAEHSLCCHVRVLTSHITGGSGRLVTRALRQTITDITCNISLSVIMQPVSRAISWSRAQCSPRDWSNIFSYFHTEDWGEW